MVITFSRQFQDRLGEDVARELIAVLNQIDSSYRNELNFARFDAKLEQRVAELRTEIADLRTYVERGFKEQTRWMFLAWATLLIPIIGLWMRG